MKKGFTLSEVLITLGIIGIVAVLTVPAVMKNYQNRLYVAQLRKAYAQIAEAAQAIMADEHCADFYETKAAAANSCSNADKGKCEAGAGYFLNKYFKTVNKDCNNLNNGKTVADLCVAVGSNQKPTDADAYKNLKGANAGSLAGEYCIETTNRATLCGKYFPTGVAGGKPTFSINVDVNSASPPNVTGRDTFWVDILPNGLIVDHRPKGRDIPATPQECGEPNSHGCIQRIIDAGWKMDY